MLSHLFAWLQDIAQHFVERWNFCRDLKYKHSDRFPLLDWPHDDPLNVGYPHYTSTVT